MFIKVIKINETEHWNLDQKMMNKIKAIWGVYVFDPNWKVHCCEITPSYELHMLHSQVEFKENATNEEIEEIENCVAENENFENPVIYMHCHVIDNAGNFKCGWFPKTDMGTYRIWGCATDFEYDPKDKAERTSQEQKHDYGIEQAIECATEQYV